MTEKASSAPVVRVWLDCPDCGANQPVEGISGKVYGVFAYLPERDGKWKAMGHPGTVYSWCCTPEQWSVMKVDIMLGKRRYYFPVVDFEVLEAESAKVAPVSMSSKPLPMEGEAVVPGRAEAVEDSPQSSPSGTEEEGEGRGGVGEPAVGGNTAAPVVHAAPVAPEVNVGTARGMLKRKRH